MNDVIKLFVNLGIIAYIAVYLKTKYNIHTRKLLVREWPWLIALVAGVWVYIAVVTAERADPIRIDYPDGRVVYIGSNESPKKKDVPIHKSFMEAMAVVGVILNVIRFSVRHIINKPKNVEEHTVECFNVKCEKPLCPSIFADNTVSGMTLRDENAVVVTQQKRSVILFCGICFLPLALDTNLWTVLLSLLGILILFLSFNFKITFDHDGMTTKNKFFDYYEKTTFLAWSEISNVRYFNGGILRLQPSFLFMGKENSFASIEQSSHKNYEECLRYAVEKLPPEVFDISARKRLSKMGICHWDW